MNIGSLKIGDLFRPPHHINDEVCILLIKNNTLLNSFICIKFLINNRVETRFYLPDAKCILLC